MLFVLGGCFTELPDVYTAEVTVFSVPCWKDYLAGPDAGSAAMFCCRQWILMLECRLRQAVRPGAAASLDCFIPRSNGHGL